MEIVHQLPNGLYDMKLEYLEEVCVVFAETFLQLNKIWSQANLDKEILKEFFRLEIKTHLQSEQRIRQLYKNPNLRMNQVLIHNKKIVGATLHMQLGQYIELSKKSTESDIPLFKDLQRQGKQLIQAVNLQELRKGKYAYASWGAQYRIPEMSTLQKTHNIALIYDQMRQDGFEGMIFRSSNDRVIAFHTMLGGILLKEVPFELNGKVFKLYFMQQQFANPKMTKFVSQAKQALGLS